LVSATYTLIINPDTLVSEDTLLKLYDHMQKNEFCGACGCKILNPDGTFAPESKRSVPTIWSAICTVLGFHYLFPKSKWFAPRYLGWLDEDKIASVPVISGACMFWNTNLLKDLNGFDGRFFMYAEDDDLCYRVRDTKYHIDYVPATSIIHYKGESSKKGDLGHIKVFSKALYQFFEKQYNPRFGVLFRLLVITAIWVRGFFSFIFDNMRVIGLVATDLFLVNLSVLFGFLLRFNFSIEIFSSIQNLKYLWINALASVLYMVFGSALDLFRSQKASISNQLKAVVACYAAVATITFFVRNLAFSRLALIYGLISAIVLMILVRLFQINLSKNISKTTGRIRSSKVLLVGNHEDTSQIQKKINSRPDWNYEVMGTIGIKVDGNGYLGTLPQLKDFVKAYKIDQVFFALKSISYKEMLSQIAALQNQRVLVKLIPDSMDFIVGKSNVEYLESIPLVEVGFSYSKGINQFLKRILDVTIALPCFLVLGLISFPGMLFSKVKRINQNPISLFFPIKKHAIKNYSRLFGYVVLGKLSLVGAPIYSQRNSQYKYKSGLTGLVQLNSDKITTESDTDNYDLYYLQNYSIWMDIDIIVKSVFSSYKLLDTLGNHS
ncbi:MAG: sugar transferase, partial [Balneolales bacterium]|nr:sugar transferase [Balneolales bacterium]